MIVQGQHSAQAGGASGHAGRTGYGGGAGAGGGYTVSGKSAERRWQES